MTGWKCWTAGLLSIVYGVGGYLLDIHDMSQGAQFVVNGLGIMGIGHKIEKISQ